MQSTLDQLNSSTIQKIIELDKAARNMVSDARAETDKIRENAQQKKERLLADYKAQADERIKSAEEACNAEADEKISALEAEKVKRLKALDDKMAANRERWKKEIFTAVTCG